MGLTITTPAPHTSLVDLAQLRRELGLSESADAVLAEQVYHVTDAIQTYCQRIFARTVLTETVAVTGQPQLLLTYNPVVLITSVLQDGAIVMDYTLDAQAGILTRPAGWTWSYGLGWNDSPRYTFGLGYAIMDAVLQPTYAVAYTGGYLLPDDDVVTPSIAVDGAAKTFTLTAGRWPLLVAGDRIKTSGFVTSANNGTWTVVTATSTVVTVSETGLVTEADSASGANPKTVRVRTLPADIQRAAIDTIKGWYVGRERDPYVMARSITGLSVSYATGMSGEYSQLPPTACALLSPYRRYA